MIANKAAMVGVVFCCVLSGVVWCFLTRSHSCCGVLSCIAWCFLAHVPVLVVLCGVFWHILFLIVF